MFRYDDGLEVEPVVETSSPTQRAAYVGAYLYVFDEDAATVLDQEAWEETRTLPLTDDDRE